jgi:hypothetical protein
MRKPEPKERRERERMGWWGENVERKKYLLQTEATDNVLMYT